MSNLKTDYRTCNICEAMCGIVVTHENGVIHTIKPDKHDTLSRGHICPKAVALKDFHTDPDRLREPLRKTATGWEAISWEAAYAEIGQRMRALQAEHGVDSVGVYLGNPNAHNAGSALFLPKFQKAVGSRNRYSSASADQLPHHVAANYLFGTAMAISVPDIDHTDFMLIIGANPVVSNGSLMSGAAMPERLKAIQARGGKVVVVDPRRTETAKLATQHLAVRPESDALLLFALIHTITAEGLSRLGHLADKVDGFDAIVSASQPFSPERVSDAVGVSADVIRTLAREFASAPSAVCYARMGASTQSFGGLCQWLTLVLNIITGNFDQQGGAMFPLPAFDVIAHTKPNDPSARPIPQSRVRKLPFFSGEFPVATLADEINTKGPGQIRGMFVIAGNPVLSAPGGDALDAAFAKLDFMVAVDIYLNETTRHADIILPATNGLENTYYDVYFNSFAVRNVAKYAPPLLKPLGNQREDWQILKGLISCLTGEPEDDSTPESILDAALRSGHYAEQGLSIDKLREHPHGLDLGPLVPCAERRIKTLDGHINLAPKIFLDDVPRLEATLDAATSVDTEFPMRMISRRLIWNHNTWTQNSQRLLKAAGPISVQLNPSDAARLGVVDGATVSVRSHTGSVEMPAEIDEAMRPGVVSIPQGWGRRALERGMQLAATHPGISINTLTDSARIDILTGNAAFNGTPVSLHAL